MSRKNRKRKTVKVRAHMQGRKLKGLRAVRILSDEEFAYQGYVYLIDNFPPHEDINLDSTEVEPVRFLENTYSSKSTPTKNQQKKQKKQKIHKKTYTAYLYSNIGECSDVEQVFTNQG
jgi:hypothetical protein